MRKSKYSEWTKEELVKRIEALEKRKKYGLVWDEEKTKEKFEAEAEGKFPVLKEIKSKEIKTDPEKPTHILIEGDNYHALSVLNYTHEKEIDIIYIDPPYNTGAQDWKYNNNFVDINDAWRHSKWLQFMYNRLKLTKRLLSNKGVLICTIDKNEQAALGLLLQELFPNYEITCIVIVHNPAGVQGKNFSYTHEFAYFIYPKNGVFIGKTSREKDLISPLRDWGGTSARKLAKNCFYPIIVKDNEIIGFGDVCEDDFHPDSANVLFKDGKIMIYPIDKNGIERKWVFSKESAEKNQEQLFIKKVNGEYVVMRKKGLFNYRTVWDDKRYYANIYGSKLLNNIIEQRFPFPKSLYAIKDCINAVIHNKEEAIILDFFAGSGTTGHAVLELNKDDGGNRKFILCTNNEANICTEITYPRIKKVIKGYTGIVDKKKYEGLEGNLKYYKTSFVPQEPTDKNRELLTKEAEEMLCLRENAFELVLEKAEYKIYKNNKKYLGIIWDQIAIDTFKKEVSKYDKNISVYVFSLTDEDFSGDFADMKKKIKVCSIPEAILRVYRRIFTE